MDGSWRWPGGARSRWKPSAQKAQELGARAIAVATDVGDPASVKNLFDRVREVFGRLDLLFNNAGHGRTAQAAGRSDLRAMETGSGHQPDGRLFVHAGGLQNHEGPEPARRPDHQQRIRVRACAAPQLRALHLHQARADRTYQVDLARRPQVRYRLRPDRYRQRRDRDDGADEQRCAAGQRHNRGRANHGHGSRRRGDTLYGQPCRSTPMSSS